MRQLLVQVPRGCGKNVLNIAKACDGVNLVHFEAIGSEKPLDVVIVHVPNPNVEELLGELESLPELLVTSTKQVSPSQMAKSAITEQTIFKLTYSNKVFTSHR